MVEDTKKIRVEDTKKIRVEDTKKISALFSDSYQFDTSIKLIVA